MKYRASKREKLMPVTLLLGVLLLDQLTKILIVHLIPYTRPPQVAFTMLNDFFRIIHTRNMGAAFSMGRGLPDFWRSLMFILLPVAVLVWVCIYYWRTQELSKAQMWSLAAVVGGGAGNLVDRMFRSLGVVDFLDVKIFGLFGMERWPTFNVADSAVVVGGILFVLLIVIQDIRKGGKQLEKAGAGSMDGDEESRA
ncbi:MAG: signal peptidase II [Spirochaetaceae bacterium]|nr:MAG: signal peptidase II [Spirochaetaceae bacterium]